MRFVGTRKVKLAALQLPGDWKRRLADPRVKAASEDLARTPRLQRPGVMADGKTIIWGRDRLAASHLAGEKVVEVDVWEATDLEAERAELVENLRRADNQDEIKARLVALEVRAQRGQTIATECCDEPPTKAEKSAARKAVAKALQTTPAAIKQAERRAAIATECCDEVPPAAEPSIETWGKPAPKELLSRATLAQGVVDRLDQRLRQVLVAITEGQEALPEAMAERLGLQGLRMLVKDSSAHLRALRPEAVCVYCHGEGPCTGCAGTGLLSESAVKAAPKELRAGAKK